MTDAHTQTVTSDVSLAIVGCGAIAEQAHVPAAMGVAGLRVSALVDRDAARADAVRARCGAVVVLKSCDELRAHADAALLALPPALHAPVAIDLLKQGIHVLVEKPMAPTLPECDRMIEAARQSGAVLAVGLVRRFQWAYRWVKALLGGDLLGPIERVDVSEGGVFDWPVTSAFFLNRDAAGGGVLADAGVHALDALLWWFGDAESVSYRDDAFGGVEADCELDLTFAGGVAAHVELSRTRAMRNTIRIRGERGCAQIAAYTNDVSLTLFDETHVEQTGWALGGMLARPEAAGRQDIFADQIADFAAAIRERREPAVTGAEGRRSVALVHRCYAAREPLRHPWVFEGVDEQDDAHRRGPAPSQEPVAAGGRA